MPASPPWTKSPRTRAASRSTRSWRRCARSDHRHRCVEPETTDLLSASRALYHHPTWTRRDAHHDREY